LKNNKHIFQQSNANHFLPLVILAKFSFSSTLTSPSLS
jgi:hypothetical protein